MLLHITVRSVKPQTLTGNVSNIRFLLLPLSVASGGSSERKIHNLVHQRVERTNIDRNGLNYSVIHGHSLNIDVVRLIDNRPVDNAYLLLLGEFTQQNSLPFTLVKAQREIFNFLYSPLYIHFDMKSKVSFRSSVAYYILSFNKITYFCKGNTVENINFGNKK
ncbi:hypothetical protein J6590_067684 [Homalodisca vitripennis]|nr:hypothetical protein J6590_067684 [Homalodisca vitripennis]